MKKNNIIGPASQTRGINSTTTEKIPINNNPKNISINLIEKPIKRPINVKSPKSGVKINLTFKVNDRELLQSISSLLPTVKILFGEAISHQ